MKRVRAIRAHVVPDRLPIRVAAGERVEVSERDTTWPAFAFVNTTGGSGWVPARYIGPGTGPGNGVMLEPYDTTELTTEAGEMLTVVATDELSGWSWLRNTAGLEGWVPDNSIEPVQA
jgi:hypothetical protein